MKANLLPSLHSIRLLTLAAFIAGTTYGAQPNATGTWKWSFTTQNGQTIDSSLDLKQEGTKLTGTYHGSRGGDSPIKEGRIEGNQVSFDIERSFQDRSFILHYKGRIDGDQLVGTVGFGEGDRTFPWEATRQPAPVDPTGTWTWTTTRQNGEPREQKLELKRDGAKLAGVYAGGFGGDAPIQEGKIEGDQVSFKISREGRNGGTFTIAFQGKIKGDTIEGTTEFQFGDQARSREWVAKRAAKTANPSGAWAWSITGPDGQTFSATMNIKWDGRVLSGTFQGDDWELPITEGKVEGDQLSFTTVRERDSGRIVYRSKATVKGETMIGKVEYTNPEGQTETREWQAKRK